MQAKYFEYLSLEGEKIGQMSEDLKQMFNNYEVQNKNLVEKQGKLFNIQGLPKWENENIDRLNEPDKKELFRDVKNQGLILPQEQKTLWEARFLHAHLV